MADKPACEHPLPKAGRKKHDPAVNTRAAAIFRALGDPGRLHLVQLLADGEKCVSEIAAIVSEGLPLISQRLKLLKSERIVSQRRDGKHIYYQLADEHIAELVANGLAHAREKHR